MRVSYTAVRYHHGREAELAKLAVKTGIFPRIPKLLKVFDQTACLLPTLSAGPTKERYLGRHGGGGSEFKQRCVWHTISPMCDSTDPSVSAASYLPIADLLAHLVYVWKTSQ